MMIPSELPPGIGGILPTSAGAGGPNGHNHFSAAAGGEFPAFFGQHAEQLLRSHMLTGGGGGPPQLNPQQMRILQNLQQFTKKVRKQNLNQQNI